MNENSSDKKLDWMYKGANSLVDREEYLLGRSVDKALEQLNAEEKEKKLGLVPPKNHVEHECIPPSIRDFNKIIQAEQVDISAKLQEDPLVAIKKREEEARRQFLQNPVQLKKLQEALKAQQLKKKKKKYKKSKNSDSDSDLDNKIAKKLKYLKDDPLAVSTSRKPRKKSKDSILDTILMHKFNQLKDKLSQEDLNDILAGNASDSDEEKIKKLKKRKKKRESSSEESDEATKRKKKERRRTNSVSSEEENPKRTRKWSSSSSNSSKDVYNKAKYIGRIDKNSYRKNGKDFGREIRKEKEVKTLKSDTHYRKRRSSSIERSRQKYSTSSDEAVEKYKGKCEKNDREKRETQRENNGEDNKEMTEKKMVKKESEKYVDKQKDEFESDLESKILKKLRMLRDSAKSKENQRNSENDDTESEHRKKEKAMNIRNKKESTSSSDSSSDDSDSENRNLHKPVHQYDSDSDENNPKPRAFGLVKSDGTKIALNKHPYEVKKTDTSSAKIEALSKLERKNVKRLTEEEKEKLRKDMMKNAEKREKERSDNLKRYREEDKREEREAAKFDKGFVHKELLKGTKDATIETRIKSNLNNIQRSSRHMDSSFSRRK